MTLPVAIISTYNPSPQLLGFSFSQ